MAIMEVTRLRVAEKRSDAFARARAGMTEAFAARPGFVRADLVRVSADEWLDLIVWERSEDFAASRRRGADGPAVAAFFAEIDAVVSSEEGWLWERS